MARPRAGRGRQSIFILKPPPHGLMESALRIRGGLNRILGKNHEFINRSISVRETEQREAKELERLGKKPEVGGDAGSQQKASRQEAGKVAS